MNQNQIVSKVGIAAGLMFVASGSSIAIADPVSDWNLVMVATVANSDAFNQARFAAITQLAVFEAVNAIVGQYKPYLGTVSAPPGSSPEAAAIEAAYTILTQYFPGSSFSLDAARAASLAVIPDGAAKSSGLAVGAAAAQAIIALRSNDGSSPPEFFLPSSSAPGEWQLTPSCPAAGGVFLHWGNVTPFGVRSSSQFRSDPPPSLGGYRYARTYQEVKDVGSIDSTVRPPDRSAVAQFFALTSAPIAWNSVAKQVTDERHASLAERARAYALMNMAISDGLVTVMETKYFYRFWRPETAIHNGDEDGNPRTDADPSWAPFITTPCFPSYPSAHASGSYAARQVLKRIYGDGRYSISLSSPALPSVVLRYNRLSEITDDIDDARVFGGIHFRTDQDAGGVIGRQVGEYVYRHKLRPRHDDDCDR
jgi:hypothetical protein